MKFRDIKYFIVFFLLGFGIPYLVQFKLNFLGATMITMVDIIGMWLLTPVVTFLILFTFYNRKNI